MSNLSLSIWLFNMNGFNDVPLKLIPIIEACRALVVQTIRTPNLGAQSTSSPAPCTACNGVYHRLGFKSA